MLARIFASIAAKKLQHRPAGIHTDFRTICLGAILIIVAGCTPGDISMDAGADSMSEGETDGTEIGDPTTGDGDGDGDAPEFRAGEMWGPCPIDGSTGVPTLCYGEDLACVPADFAEANICLPLNACPSEHPPFGTVYEVGWGDACYPRCIDDGDCGEGMVCGASLADGGSMCAWPRD
jgi:hypothetical protein